MYIVQLEFRQKHDTHKALIRSLSVKVRQSFVTYGRVRTYGLFFSN